jgi:hypothetical protein
MSLPLHYNLAKQHPILKYLALCSLFLLTQATTGNKESPVKLEFTREQLQDKVMGGWAGQTIGVTFGGPTEFKFNGTIIQEYQKIPWYNGYLKETFGKNPGLYDDLYMDLTFVEVFDREGLDAPIKSFANAYANAGYKLWHANQAGRYNILHGMEAPASGNWLNNPHADDIDFQIEADFAGLMCPGMPRSASEICDKIGHIMNSGDGYYGGVYISNLYALAFTSNRIENIVREALKSIPEKSDFHRCISAVLQGYRKNPKDWKVTWFEIQKKWAEDIGCPDGVYNVFDIDAKLNAAYVVLGLLYGDGDFSETLNIATRAGQDSDCNPSSAAGILGVMLGYKNIPEEWKEGLQEIEALDFKYTTMSLQDAYASSLDHAMQMIERNGGKTKGSRFIIPVQKPEAVKFEKNFAGHFPSEKRSLNDQVVEKDFEFQFEGIGFVLSGGPTSWDSISNYNFKAELYLNHKYIEQIELPVDFTKRRTELFWKFQLPYAKYDAQIRILNPSAEHKLKVSDLVVYTVRNN